MTVQLWNTLTKRVEEFGSIEDGAVGMYVCGPTVYRPASIGNFRSYVFADVLRRALEVNGYAVKQVMNITDVGHLTDDASEGEDKVEREAREKGLSAWDIAEMYTNLFFADSQRLNILPPHVVPKATEHIQEQIELIQKIESEGCAYTTSDGVYFDTSKLEDYGKLSGQKVEDKEAGARVEVNAEKRNPADFALWKFSKPEEQRQMEWESPWGVGFPGWHIECSAMSEKYLGSPFDIHTGGIDHIPVHHTNEIAQTQAARGNSLANVWMHNEFLLVDGGKMSKSLGNTYTVTEIEEKGIDPLALRYFFLGAHYRTQLNFTWDALKASENGLNHARKLARQLPSATTANEKAMGQFLDALNDDLDTPGALAVFWEIIQRQDIDAGEKSATILKIDEVLGLNLAEYIGGISDVPAEIQKLVESRETARKEKNFEDADSYRAQIEEAGFEVEDSSDGPKIYKKI